MTPEIQPIFEKYSNVWNQLESAEYTCDVKCHADYLVWNNDSMALRVNDMQLEPIRKLGNIVNFKDIFSIAAITSIGKNEKAQLVSGNPAPHITLAYRKGIKAAQTNIMLQTVFGKENSPKPLNHLPKGWNIVPIDLSFNATLKKYVGSSNISQ